MTDLPGDRRTLLSPAADAQLDVISSRARSIASDLFAISASIRESSGTDITSSLEHRINSAAESALALAAPPPQLRSL